MSSSTTPSKSPRPRGFAAMDPARVREIASRGGRSVPPENRSFFQNRALATAAGAKGGRSLDPAKRSFARDRELAVSAGRKGGANREG